MDKIYVGKGKAVGQFGDLAFSVCITDATPYFFEYNGKTYLKLKIGKMRNPDEHGKTHTVTVDNFKPDASYKKPVQQEGEAVNYPAEDVNPDDIPF